MLAALRSSWPLFVGMVFLMISNGLLLTLLTLRASALGFPEAAIGLMQSAYPVGALAGCLVAPRLVVHVGHVRVFAALASVASTAALVHLVTTDPYSWAAMRMLAGFCFAGLYVVAESWLNGRATNETRGSLLSLYFVIQTGGSAAGQLLLNLGSPEGILLFVLVSVLISLSLVPILISARATPPYAVPERISLTALFRISPMGMTGSFLNGVAQGAIYVGLALYGRAMGLDDGAVGTLVGAAMLGGMVLQVPLGRLSDRIDRRLVMVGAAGLAVPVCLALAAFGTPGPTAGADLWLLYAGVGLMSGLTLPLYSICAAHTNDYLTPGQVVAASGALVLVLGAGVAVGPTLASLAVARGGPTALFLLLAAVQGLTVSTALFRFWHGHPRPDTTGIAVPMAHTVSGDALRLSPDAPPLERKTEIK